MVRLLKAIAAVGIAVVLGGVKAADPPVLPTVTVQAPRDRKELEREVSTFVTSTVVRPFDKSLARWISPICPMVAGLSRREGEYILARISQVALAAHAPLDKESIYETEQKSKVQFAAIKAHMVKVIAP